MYTTLWLAIVAWGCMTSRLDLLISSSRKLVSISSSMLLPLVGMLTTGLSLAVVIKHFKHWSMWFQVVSCAPTYRLSQKKMDKRFIIVPVLSRALFPAQFDTLMAVVYQEAITQESLKGTHPHTIHYISTYFSASATSSL